jgi:AraC-like DNA-binding protein
MVSIRCKMIMREELHKLGLHSFTISLGEVDITGDLTAKQLKQLNAALLRSGLEIINDKRAILIEKIKAVVIEMVHYLDEHPDVNFSIYLCEKLGYSYTYLANIFSEVEGITIEKFLIAHKIEKVKELIIYDELNLTEIANKLHYCSVQHLSTQFKKVTGLTPSFFKSLTHRKRNPLEDL